MKKYDVVIVGAGFTGLTAAYVLSKQGKSVCVVEADATPGGLAGVFEFDDGVKVEKFYHHWFNIFRPRKQPSANRSQSRSDIGFASYRRDSCGRGRNWDQFG